METIPFKCTWYKSARCSTVKNAVRHKEKLHIKKQLQLHKGGSEKEASLTLQKSSSKQNDSKKDLKKTSKTKVKTKNEVKRKEKVDIKTRANKKRELIL